MSLRAKLIAAFLTLVALTSVIGVIGVFSLRRVSSHVDDLGANLMPSIESLLIISEAQSAIDGSENALMMKDISPANRSAALKRFADSQRRFEAAWKVYEALPQTKEEAVIWGHFVSAWNVWWADHGEFVRRLEAFEKSKSEEDYKGLTHQSLDVEGVSFGAARGLLDQVVDINRKGGEAETTEALSVASAANTTMVLALLLAIALGVALGLILSSSIARSLTRVIDAMSSAAEQVASASGQVSSSSQQMASGASTQASNLEEVSSSLEEVTSMTRQNADNARRANGSAQQASSAANDGAAAMLRMSAAIEKIRASSIETSKIVKTIDEIAFQTNLLALNAAVEAARAGDSGKGFAVVAEEVRNLAQRSAEAAKNTASLLEEAQKNADGGVKVASDVNTVLSAILTAANEVRGLVAQVATASEQQTSGVTQINTSVGQMDRITQSNAANAEESASASEELSAQAMELNELVAALVGLVNGDGAHQADVRKPAARKAVRPVQRVVAEAPARAQAPRPSEGAAVHASLLAEFAAEKPADGEFRAF